MADSTHSNPDARGPDLPIADAEQQLQQLVDTALDAVITCDAESRIVVWNSGAEKLFGWPATEAIGLTLTETIIPLEFREAHTRGMAHYLKTGQGPVLGQRIEIEAINRDGRRFPVELSINPIRTKQGIGFSGFIRDISDRLEAEKLIREGQERLQFIFDAAHEGVWDYQFDVDGAVIDSFFGEKTRQLLGEGASTIPPKRSNIYPEDRDGVNRAWELHWNQVQATFELEYRLQQQDSKHCRWVRERGIIVRRDDDGKPLRAVGSVVDITAQKNLETTLLSAQKREALGLIAGGFAHDINNVLSIIKSYTSIQQLNKELPKDTLDSLHTIDLAVLRARTLTQNMLQLGRPIKSHRQITEVKKLLLETLQLIQPSIPNSIQVRRNIDLDETDNVFLNPEQLQQAILNLMLNARDAMGQGGTLEIKASNALSPASGQPSIFIEIIDSGCGIEKESLAMIFEPFFTTKGQKGTGLGLSTVKKFVEDCHGMVSIDSEVNRGTSVKIELPQHAGQTESDAFTAVKDSVTPSNILLAEDHPLLRPMLKGAIAITGHHVEVAEDAAQVLATGTACQPDLMVMDIDLPGGRGDELAGDIRAHWNKEIPVIFITGNSSFKIEDSDTTILLYKPFDLERLIEAISKMLDIK